MKYQINKTNYRTFNIFQDNKLPGRSYFIPYPNKEECDKVSFIALNDTFELGIKPYTDRALIQMKHNKDEIRTGTYVTIQDFQQGIGTGACGPYIAKEYLYKANKKYTVKFLIKIS